MEWLHVFHLSLPFSTRIAFMAYGLVPFAVAAVVAWLLTSSAELEAFSLNLEITWILTLVVAVVLLIMSSDL